MISNASSTHVPPLGTHQRGEVGLQLQATLIEVVRALEEQLAMIRAQLPDEAR